jgi:serine/threonine protein kinase
MSQPPSDPKAATPRKDTPASAPAERADLSQAIQAVAEDLLPGVHLGPSDESPTVITKNNPRPQDVAAVNALQGRKLAHFELLGPIGVGGMAAVLRAHDTQLDRFVALKILPPEMATDPENIRRFHQEARAAAKLDHENIARVFFCGEDQGLHFIAFELVEGENLQAILERRGRIPVNEAIPYMLQVASGLAHAAQRGVVHRDIKPSNIIISASGRAKLVDMGLARSQGKSSTDGLTQSGVTLGTFDYISPEQALDPREADARSDIYSLGCTFYHLLTGQAPVPEGTAAKKLHYHQQVAPIDPRQLNPGIPDEVAAILGRMMAKDPKNRYQQPEHLVQHLLAVAQKVGVSTDLPEGMLFVDAPLPNPPMLRPLLMGCIAATVLVALILIFGQANSGPPPSGDSPPPGKFAGTDRTGEKEKDSQPRTMLNGGQVAPAAPSVASGVPAVYKSDRQSVGEINKFLQQNPEADVFLDDLDLTEGQNRLDGSTPPSLVFAGKRLTIQPTDEAKEMGKRPTIRLTYDGRPKPSATWKALVVKSGDVVIKKLRFVVDARAADDIVLAAVQWQGGTILFEDCEFVQVQPPEGGTGRVSSIEIAGSRGDRPAVVAQDCSFIGVRDGTRFTDAAKGGHIAVAFTSPGWMKMTNCAFGPHADHFYFPGNGKTELARLELARCSAFLNGASTVFHLGDKKPACQVDVKHCVFSRPGGPGAGQGDETSLVRQDDPSSSLKYLGEDNRYHGLQAYWKKPGQDDFALDLADFQREVANAGGQDDGSMALAANPWSKDDPLTLLDGLDSDKLREAFRLNTDAAEAWQEKNLVKLPVGVLSCTWGKTYDDKTMATEKKVEPVSQRRERIVDPDPLAAPGSYKTLGSALGDAEPGDVILLKYSGMREEPAVRLEKVSLDVTIRPYPDHHPILFLGATSDEDAALFHLHVGKLTLEGIEFLLQPSQADFKSQTIVALFGDGECALRNCVATLREPRGVPLAFMTLADPSRRMRMGNGSAPNRPAGRSRMKLENCFVRGDGDLITVRGGRGFDLAMDNVLAALSGSLLNVEANREEISGAAAQAIQAQIENTTAYLGEHFARFRGNKDVRGLPHLEVKPAAKSVFISANTGSHAFIHLDGLEATDQQVRQILSWESRGGLRYANFMQMLDQSPKDDRMPPPPFSQEKWKTFCGDTDAQQFARGGKFVDLPSADFPFAKIMAAYFRTDPNSGVSAKQLTEPAVDNPKK